MASQGHITAGDARTADAGGALLKQGGNAVDAAVGAMFAAFAAEPVLTGPFGGGFGMVAGPKLAPKAYDFFADIPGRGLPPASSVPELDFRGLEVSFGPTTQVFHGGRGAAAVPLLMQGLLQLHSEHGRLPLADVVAPAIALAKEGVALSQQILGIANILTPIVTLTPDTAKLFAPQGHVLKPGEKFTSPDLAGLLQRAADGQLQRDWEAVIKTFGAPHGRLTEQDLQASQVHENTPISVQLGDYTIALNPPPSLGGLLVGFGLRLLADVPKSVWADETESTLQIFGALAVSQAVRSQQVDPAALGGSAKLAPLVQSMLADSYVNAWKGPMADVVRDGPPKGGYPVHNLGGTTHVSCIDGDGLACSITSSNGEGNGWLVPGCGVMINNFLGEEDINPGGFHKRPAGERMTSMMCPLMVLKDGRPVLALGTGGSNRIRTALLQVLVHHLLRGEPLEAAVKMPRLHYEGGPLFVERKVLGMALSAETLQALEDRVSTVAHFDAPNMFFGGVHAASAVGMGVGDPRRGGSMSAG